MSDVFAEATVRISPSLTGFKTDLEDQLKKIMDKVKVPPVRVGPALTRDFVGDLRKQINAAVEQAQKGVKPVRIKAFIEPVGIAAGTAGMLTGGGGGRGGGGGGGGGGGSRAATAANQALARSIEDVATANVRLGKAFDKTLTAEEQSAAVTKVVTALDDAQAQAEKSLEKAIVAKDAALQKSARRQLADIADFRTSLGPRAAEVGALTPSAPAAAATAGTKAQAGAKAAIKSNRQLSDSLKTVVADMQRTDAAAAALGTSTEDLAGHQAVLRERTQQLATVTRLEKKLSIDSNVVVKQGIANSKLRAAAAVESAQKQVASIESVAKAEAQAAKQAERLSRAQETSRRRAAAAAASQAASERRRSEQLSRGGQASLLSLAGIRGATLAASRSFLVGAAAITVFARAVKQFADLERNLDVFRATTSATAEQMEAVRREATELGADLTLPAVSAGDAAGAMVELAKAGLSVQDSIDGARAVLELSTAAAIDNADAVRLVANVLNAFSLAGRDATAVADTLANAANAAQGSIADIGTAFQQAASAGHQVGLSFQDTATFLTILAKNGIRGSDAGTSLRTALIRLVNPSKDAQEQFNKLGIVLRDAAGNLRPDVFLQIADATRRLGPAQRDATIALIGGQDAFRAVTILGRQSVDAFLAMRAALRQEGTAAELAAARTEGLHGAMDGLQSVLETVGTNVAGHVGPALAGFVRTVADSITAFSENEQVAKQLNQTLEATATSFNLLGQAISTTLSVALPLANVLSQVATSIGVTNILAGVVAFKTFNAVLDGAILRLRLLKPLFAVIATARIGSNIASGVTAASLALGEFNKAAGVTANQRIPGFKGLVQAEKELAVTMAAATPKVSAFRSALTAIGPAAVALATSTGGIAIAAAAAGAAILFFATRETAAERATRHLREETEKLADAFDRVEREASNLRSADRAAQQGQTGIQQAQLNLRAAQQAVAQSDAGPSSRERKQLLLSVRIAQQDLTFATEDYKKSLDDLVAAQEANRAAEINANRERGKARKVLQDLIDDTLRRGRGLARVAGVELARKGLTGETAARLVLIDTLRKQATQEAVSDQASERAIATRKRLVALIVEQSNIPLDKLAPRLDQIFASGNLEAALRRAASLFHVTGTEAVDEFIKAVVAGFADTGNLGLAIKNALEAAKNDAASTAENAGVAHADFYEHGFSGRFANVVGPAIAASMKAALSSATELALLELEGASLQTQLSKAQDILDQKTRQRIRTKAKFDQFPTPNNKKAVDNAVEQEKAARADVERIQGEIESAQKDTEQRVKDAQDDRDKRGQSIVDAILDGRRATLLQRRITRTGLTAWLSDDLKANQDWLDFLRAQRKALLARLKAIGASKSVISAAMKQISDLIFGIKTDIKKLTNDIANNAKEVSEILNSVAFQKIDIRIRIANIQENTAAELRLRRIRLEMITRELVKIKRTVGKNTLAWLQLKEAQVEEIKAIEELEKAQRDKNNANAQLAFAFLQAQAGFAANLLNNLLPMGAIGGTLGNAGGTVTGGATRGGGGGTVTGSAGGFNIGSIGRPPEGAPRIGLPGGPAPATGLDHASQRAEAESRQGFTAAQAATLIALTKQVVNLLAHINGANKHPEAKKTARANRVAMDTHK